MAREGTAPSARRQRLASACYSSGTVKPPRAPSLVLAALCAACTSPRSEAPRDGGRRAPERPSLPAMVPDDPGAHACFPRDFETTRARVRGDHLELCGLSMGRPRCYSVDPVTSFVRVIEVADAPTIRPPEPVFEAPLTRRELTARGARADARAGNLSLLTAGGASRVIEPRTLGLSSMDNGVMCPWGDGWFVAVFGVGGRDLGASAIMETGKVRLRGRAAFDPCPAGS